MQEFYITYVIMKIIFLGYGLALLGSFVFGIIYLVKSIATRIKKYQYYSASNIGICLTLLLLFPDVPEINRIQFAIGIVILILSIILLGTSYIKNRRKANQ